MASLFAHGAVALTLGYIIKGNKDKITWLLLLFFGFTFAILPDIDIISFTLDIPYLNMYGHRGITHSIFFALMMAVLFSPIFRRTVISAKIAFIYLFASMLSHGVLDAMTTGGRGVAFFAPFCDHRYFLPWRFIQVSPLGVSNFFSEWGLAVIINEGKYIGIPCLLIILITYSINKINN